MSVSMFGWSSHSPKIMDFWDSLTLLSKTFAIIASFLLVRKIPFFRPIQLTIFALFVISSFSVDYGLTKRLSELGEGDLGRLYSDLKMITILGSIGAIIIVFALFAKMNQGTAPVTFVSYHTSFHVIVQVDNWVPVTNWDLSNHFVG
jgi:hypothetical protein